MIRICFVCQAGALEPKAVLLAASLRAYFPVDIELIAAHPAKAGPLKPEVEQALSDLNVRIVPIGNPLGADYPIGHKLSALALTAGGGLGLLVDTDVLAMGAPATWPTKLGLAAATDHHYDRPTWEHAYGRFGLSVPAAKAATLVTQDWTAPYYNSGVIAAPGSVAAWLAMTWTETAARIDEDPDLASHHKRPHLADFAFPIAASRLGLDVDVLDVSWNFPSWAWTLEGRQTPYLFHYQSWSRLRAEEGCRAAITRSANILPSVRRALASFPQP